MLWQIIVEPLPSVPDSLGATVARELVFAGLPAALSVGTARLYVLEGDVDRAAVDALVRDLLVDPVAERAEVHEWDRYGGERAGTITVRRKPGVMDPSEASVLRAAERLGHPLTAVSSATRYAIEGVSPEGFEALALTYLANEAIEEVQIGNDRLPAPRHPGDVAARRVEVPLRESDGPTLAELSRKMGLSLTEVEMVTIRDHFRSLGREPTEIELETLAQTWSEHCKHKTFTQPIDYSGPPAGDALGASARIPNLLKDTIKHATRALDRDFCLSVFHDNAGVIAFEGDQALAFKVETHNHPSAIEPYGGAGTGIGGVIRDILGTGCGALPVANIDVFCVGPPDMPAESIPKGATHPLRILRGVVAGVRDYGNRMGIPTVAGAVKFDERYVGNPLVYAGTVGLLPKSAVDKEVRPGDAIVAVGGATGRDGIHGATFSSVELHEESETLDSGAVQIGNAITEKKVADVVLEARDRGLFRGLTDCGAGGFSSAVGEMGAECGARVQLERAPLKYPGLSPTEIWISEAQERMVLAVQPENVDAVLELCASEDVSAVVLGEFTDTGRLELRHGDLDLGDLDMGFLHDGLPEVVRTARFEAPAPDAPPLPPLPDASATLLRLLSDPDVASKEWIIRQYDHEVQAGSAVKPLVGTRSHGPSDAAVVAPLLGETVGFALGLGLNPSFGDLDPYDMACAVVDEALRNVVAVGADPDHCAILDNFCWGNTAKPDRLGGLVRAAFGCRDAALALGTPFISGKDSLNNEYQTQSGTIVIPPSLLISAVARVPDVRRCVTMDLKSAGNLLFLVGETADEMGGSLFLRHHERRGATVPRFDGARARKTFAAMHAALSAGLARSCHDLSEGGLAVSAAEMVLAGEIGARLELAPMPVADPGLGDTQRLFAESLSRFLVEVAPENADAFEAQLEGVPVARIGTTTEETVLEIVGSSGQTLVRQEAAALESAFRDPLTRHLDGRSTANGGQNHG